MRWFSQLNVLILHCDNAVVRVWLGQGKQITQDQGNWMFWFKVPTFLNINTPAKSSSTSLSGRDRMLTIVALSQWPVVSCRAIHSWLSSCFPLACVITQFRRRCSLDKMHWSTAAMSVVCNLSRRRLTPNVRVIIRSLVIEHTLVTT